MNTDKSVDHFSPCNQQKRQSSLSGYPLNSKRQPNPLQLPMGISGPDQSQPHNLSTAALSPRLNNIMRNNIRRNLIQQQQQQQLSQQQLPFANQTPTPSAYGVPSSPGIQAPASSSQLNNSELPDSNDDTTPYNKGASPSQTGSATPSTNAASTTTTTATAAGSSSTRTMLDEEQQLATKLKETYKNIVNYEEVVQKSCLDLTAKINAVSSTGGSVTSHSHPSTYLNNAPTTTTTTMSGVNTTTTTTTTTSSTTGSMGGINTTRTSELSNDLWTVYHHNITLLDNYYDFLVTALKPSSNQTHFKTGKNIVDLYKIPRRMWVYGIVGFLEVLKNIMNIFQDHEICLCFISYCFNIISNLTDPVLEMEGWWAEKLGDLSRMAIALYLSRFIDWKISAEHWYQVAMKTLYGHGKIYYHMCTVQQDNLDALVNIGKSVFCHDPFVPTLQYLRLVVENICTQRNILSLLELPLIDFIKIHKVLLSIYPGSTSSSSSVGSSGIHDTQLQYGIDLVTRYGLTFGSDPNGYNFFTKELYAPQGVAINDPHHPYYLQNQNGGGQPNPATTIHQQQHLHQHHQQLGVNNTAAAAAVAAATAAANTNNLEKLNFWFNKGPLFAIANINHLVGLGDARNPFAKLFELPEALKERKDKKDRKRKSRTSSSAYEDSASGAGGISAGGVDGQTITASDLSTNDWFVCLQYINRSVLELSIRILNNYLVGPKQALTCHVIVWLYFLVSVGEATNKYPNSKTMMMWIIRKFLPWTSMIKYLNSILQVTKNSLKLKGMVRDYLTYHPNYLQNFNETEFLPEVWKCWGTLWFDFIAGKVDYTNMKAAGVSNENLFDLPICGTSPIINVGGTSSSGPTGSNSTRSQQEEHNDERIVRIVLLARYIADTYDFGLVRKDDEFLFDKDIYDNMDKYVSPTAVGEAFPYIEKFLLIDGRFIQNNFLQPIPMDFLTDSKNNVRQLLAQQKDEVWFGVGTSRDEDDVEIGDEDDELESYGDSEFDDEEYVYDQQQQSLQQQQQHLQQRPYTQQQLQGQQLLDQQVHLHHLQQHQQLHHHQSNHMIDMDPFMDGDYMLPPGPGGGMGANQATSSGTVSSYKSLEGNLGHRMDTNITYITLDTNIWLKHCGRIFKCIRNGIFKILIPLIVFQELRSLRKSAEATIADSATRSVIIIRELYLSREILPLRFDGTVASDINETTEFENNSNWRTSVDETILNSVNEHDEIGKKLLKGLNVPLHNTGDNSTRVLLDAKLAKSFSYCVLITDDRNMRLRAKTIGLTSFQSRWLFAILENIFADKCID